MKDPQSRPLPDVHSKMKEAAFRSGYVSFMYEPSVTATRVDEAVEVASHAISPLITRFSHIQVLPHPVMSCQKSAGGGSVGAQWAVEVTLYTAGHVDRTEHIVLWSTDGTAARDHDQQFGLFA